MSKFNQITWGLLTILFLPGSSSAQLPELRLWGPVGSPAADAQAIERVRDIAYVKGLKADLLRHRLDLYLPKEKRPFPIIVFVHGGGWAIGDNRCAGLYTTVGEFLASRGIGVVMPNYRLSPWVKHPEHAKDVARAVAWTRSNIAKHGGDPKQMFLGGHSAGGHLAALLATDESFLKAEGMARSDIRGVIAVSGVYRLPEGDVKVKIGNDNEDFRPEQILPLRAEEGKAESRKLPFAMPLTVNVYGVAFGRDPKTRVDASPINHISSGMQPFLILTAANDLPTLTSMAEEFHQALKAKGNTAELVRIADRNHNSIIFNAIQVQDPVSQAIVNFVNKHAR